MGNTGLPYNPDTPQEGIDQVKAFWASNTKLNLFSMAKEVGQMHKRVSESALKFMYWQNFCRDTENPPIGILNSFQMEHRSKLPIAIQYFFQRLGLEEFSPCTSNISKAFEAPFPNASFKMGIRAMPSHVPTIPDASLDAQRKAIDFFGHSTKPFLSVFAGDDPITNGIEAAVLNMAPNAKSVPHIGGGHFYQWTRAEKLSSILT